MNASSHPVNVYFNVHSFYQPANACMCMLCVCCVFVLFLCEVICIYAYVFCFVLVCVYMCVHKTLTFTLTRDVFIRHVFLVSYDGVS